MRLRSKIVALSLLSALAFLGIFANLPIVNTGTIEPGCSSFTKCTPPHYVYESLLDKYFPCTFQICLDSSVKTITLSEWNLSSGTATTQNLQGTAHFVIAFNNPGATTKISSYSLSPGTNASLTLYQCSSSISCTALSSPTIPANRVTSFDTAATMFYISRNISSGEEYNYVFNFANGQSISGTVRAN
jgi:hypothetical protein